ncbi:MAG: helix-turn-helix domain-containing protein, partial [Spirochaetota bacterium]
MNKSGARQKLLEAGMKLFYEKGYYRSGMREIAEFAGVAVTNIFTYFKSKEGFAIAYLLKQEREQAKGLVLLMRQYPNPIDFFQAWFDHLKTKILANE